MVGRDVVVVVVVVVGVVKSPPNGGFDGGFDSGQQAGHGADNGGTQSHLGQPGRLGMFRSKKSRICSSSLRVASCWSCRAGWGRRNLHVGSSCSHCQSQNTTTHSQLIDLKGGFLDFKKGHFLLEAILAWELPAADNYFDTATSHLCPE